MNPIKNYRTAARLALGAVVAGSLLVLPMVDQAATYSYTDLIPKNLQPTGFLESTGNGISSGHQVGYCRGNFSAGRKHAILWSGTASSMVDLNPSEFIESSAFGVSGNQQIGYGSPSSQYGPGRPATLWT